MKILKEITGVVGDFRYPEHTYYIENSKCVAYIKEGTDELITFKKPLMFDRARRKFQELS